MLLKNYTKRKVDHRMENPYDTDEDQYLNSREFDKNETEEIILIYLEDYYRTLDDEYLKEALQLAKDEGIDIEKVMQRAKSRLD
jgi:hypothetical protein